MSDILVYLICGAVFAVLYALKGGSGPHLFKNWAYVREKSDFYDRLLDGKVISTILAFITVALFTTSFPDLQTAQDWGVVKILLMTPALFALGWLVSVAPSMGEEHGAIGTSQGGWGQYVVAVYPGTERKAFGRGYGVKKGIQRGIFIGAVMAAFTGFLPFVLWSLAFVPMVFIGQELYFRWKGQNSWVLSEPLIGLFCYGMPTAQWILSQ